MKTIHTLFKKYSTSTCNRHIHRALAIQQGLNDGVDYQVLGGKKLHLGKGLIRFKLGNFRLIYTRASSGFTLEALIQRKNLNRFLKRR